MKERPILFTPENAQKVHDGVKVQTRRIVKPQPLHISWFEHQRGWCARVREDTGSAAHPAYVMMPCPYGQVGDRLWIKHHTWKPTTLGDIRNDQRWNPVSREIIWRIGPVVSDVAGVSETSWKKVNGLFMPRWACRTVVELTEIRVERVNDISPSDALAEGIFCPEIGYAQHGERAPVLLYGCLWNSINGKDSWAQNPWVWVLTFRKVEP